MDTSVSTSAPLIERVPPALVDLDVLLRQIQHERQWDRATGSKAQRRTASGSDDDDGDSSPTDRSCERMGDRYGNGETCEQIRDVFARMDITAPLSSLSLQPPKPRNKSRVKRWHAVQDVHLYSWQFAETSSLVSVSDVDTQQFPYEILRGKRLIDTGSGGSEEDDNDQKVVEKGRFLLHFNRQYVEKAVNILNRAPNQSVAKLKIVFGRTLFHLDTLCPEVEYTREFILEAQHAGFIRTSRSNVLDADSRVLQALLADLKLVVENATNTSSTQPSQANELLTVYVKFRNTRQRDMKVTYTREEDQWTFHKCRLNSGTRYAFDVNLGDRVEFRGRVYEKVDASIEDFERTRRSLSVQPTKDSENCVNSIPKVDLVAGSPLQLGGAVIEKVWCTYESVVMFRDVRFKIIEGTRDRGEVQLEARLPKTLPDATEAPLGAQFEAILVRVQTMLEKYR